MTTQEYIQQYQRTAKWELLNIKRALELFGGYLNTDEENHRLEAVKVVLKQKRAKQ